MHCVIIGFGLEDRPGKVIYEYEGIKDEPLAVLASNINPYLVDAPNVALSKRRTPICPVSELINGSKPTDGGHLIFSDEEKIAFVKDEPAAEKWIRPFLGADEFINNTPRWCLWLVDCPSNELRNMPEVMKRVQAVKTMRMASSDQQTQSDAATPSLFQKVRQPQSNYLLVPSVSSERRAYVPISFIDAKVIVSNLVYSLPNATPFHFGILNSVMHNAWMRYTCGRLKSDYRYSNSIVYNNFPWPDLESNQPRAQAERARAAIETAAQAVLDTRAQFPDSSLADLYDPLSMPPALVKAHQKLDAAVDKAYELSGGKKNYKNDAERVAYLFELYQRYTSLLPTPTAGRKKAKMK